MSAWQIILVIIGTLLVLPVLFVLFCAMLALVAKDYETLEEAQQEQDADRWAKHTARKVMREEKWWL